jgi:membrane protein
MGFAALAMLTVFPLLVVVAAASTATRHGLALWVVYGMSLTGASALTATRSFVRLGDGIPVSAVPHTGCRE